MGRGGDGEYKYPQLTNASETSVKLCPVSHLGLKFEDIDSTFSTRD